MKKTLFDDVTARIVGEMEQGRLPWVKEWDAGNVPTRPVNASTDAAYNGVNILLLWGTLFERGYSVNAWLTFKQAQAMGGNVRKGEKGTKIVKVVTFETQEAKEKAASSGDEAKKRAALKTYSVFNVAQIDGLPDDLYAPREVIAEPERHARAEALAKATGAKIVLGGARACYNTGTDAVHMPPINAFATEATYYATLLHELAHWTGHASRLDAKFGFKGTRDYYREELRAELAAAFLCASLGIVPINRHSDYLAGYIAALKQDPKALFQSASAASKAANFILAFETEAEELDKAAA